MGSRQPGYVTALTAFHDIETTSSGLLSSKEKGGDLDWTTAGSPLARTPEAIEEARTAIHELRKLSGLTWDQIAKLFNVSRRSLHFWASGKPLRPHSEECLGRLLSTIRFIDRGSASLNRRLLFQATEEGNTPFDLMVGGNHEQVKQILGPGHAPHRPKLKPLSQEAQEARRPPKPEDLVDALQDPIHREVGRSRAAKAVKVRKRDKQS